MKKILVVEDDVDIAFVVKHILNTEGFEVFNHYDGINVPELVKSYDPDLVLLDINLPGKLGTEICRELKDVSDLPPVIMFSAHVAKGQMPSSCRADDFIEKPFTVQHLVTTIQQHLN